MIAGNFIGIGADGTSNIANASGIWVEGDCDGLQIGDMAYMDRNVISHNSPYGIVATSGADSLLIINNYIGTDSTGTAPAGNSDSGISLSTGYHTIGRPGAAMLFRPMVPAVFLLAPMPALIRSLQINLALM